MKKLIFHIGVHKTGSTSLQRFFAHNQSMLNIYFPKSGRKSAQLLAHHNLAWELNNDKRFNSKNGTVSDLLEELSNVKADRVLLSSEDFEVTPIEKIKEFKSGLNKIGYEIIPLVFVRPQWELVNSVYTETIKMNRANYNFDEFVKLFKKKERFNYNEQLGNFLDLFSTCRVLNFEKSFLKSGLEEYFFTEIGQIYGDIFIIQDMQKIKTNETPSTFFIAVMKYINDLIDSYGLSREELNLKKNHYNIRQFEKKYKLGVEKFKAVDYHYYVELLEFFDKHNNEFARKYCNREKLFYDEPSELNFKVNTFDLNSLTHTQIMELSHLITFH